MPDEIVIRFSVKDDGSPVIERVNQKIKQTQKETTALAPGLEKARREMTDFVSENAGLIAVATGAALALKKLYETAREGAEIEYTAIKFERLSNSIGTTSDALLGKLREATRGTISDMEAMGLASDLLSLGLAKNADEAVRLARVQSGLSMDMNQLVLTLTNQTTMRFDQLGVSVDGFKEKVAALEAQGYSTNDAFKEAFLQQAEMQLEKVGNAADETIGSFKRLEASFKNVSDQAKRDISDGFVPFIEVMADGMDANYRYGKALEATGMSQKKFAYMAQQAGMTVTEYTEYILTAQDETAHFGDIIEKTGGQAQLTADQLKEITDVNKGMLALIGDIQSAEERYQDKGMTLNAERKKIEQERADAIAAGWSIGSEKIQDYDRALEENSQKTQDNQKEFEKANLEILSGLVERKLMQDGVLDDAEFEWLLKKRQEWGIYSEETVAKARAVWQEADKITASLNGIPSNISTNINLNVSQQAYADRYTGLASRYRDAPSQGSAGGVHIISPAASPEMFIPGQSGSFVPNADKNLIDYKKMARAFRDAMNQAGG